MQHFVGPHHQPSRAPQAMPDLPPQPRSRGSSFQGEETIQVGIVGAGISGLALGLALRAQGISYRIFERRRQVGGLIRTVQVRGLRLELGPQRLRASPELFHHLPEELDPSAIRPAGSDSNPDSTRVFVLRDGILHPVPSTLLEALASPALSPRGRARAILWPFRAAQGRQPEHSSAADRLRWLAGEEAYRTLLGPLFGGLYGSDPERMDAHRSLVGFLGATGGRGGLLPLPLMRRRSRSGPLGSPPFLPPRGMAQLPGLLHELQTEHVELEAPVRGLRSRPQGGYLLEAGGREHPVKQIVLTSPPDAAAHLLREAAPGGSERLRRLRMNPLVMVHLQSESLPPGLGFQTSFGEPWRTRGVTFAGNLDGSGSTAVVHLGGMKDPQVTQEPDGYLGRLAASEFRKITGRQAEPVHVHRAAMPAWDRSWEALDGLELPPGIHLLTNYTGRPGIPGRLREARALALRLREV